VTNFIEIDTRFRRLIARRYRNILLLAFLSVMPGLVMLLPGIPLHPLLHAFGSFWVLIVINIGYEAFRQRRKLLSMLAGQSDNKLSQVETQLEVTLARWQNGFPARMIPGTLLMAGLLVTMIMQVHNSWIWAFAGGFIAYILGMAWLSWIRFAEQILLQDIRHAQRDQAS
jgi:hypothetical protein